MSQDNLSVPSHRRGAVSRRDRALDTVAVLTLVGGIALFGVGRSSLAALAAEVYQKPPAGVSWVSRAERHDAQTKWGAWLACAGVVLSAGAAMRHASAKRREV